MGGTVTMDARGWTPMRWPCGPLDIERAERREGFSTDERDALDRWRSPEMLDRLDGTPVDCLVVTWAEGSPTDEAQQRSLASLIAAAREAGLARRSAREFLGVTGLPWPGLKVDPAEDADAASGPTGPPWIDSNACPSIAEVRFDFAPMVRSRYPRAVPPYPRQPD